MSDPQVVMGVFIFWLGALLGSFANVIIYRWPKGESVVAPRSRCTKCGHVVAWYDNIPMVSWFILRGRCRQCKEGFSWRYPFVEFLMAVLFAAIYVKVGWSFLLFEYLFLCFGLVTVTFIDFDHMLLPNVFTLSGIVIGLVGAAINPEREFLDALYGFLMGGGFLWAVAWLYATLRNAEGMGGGDIKLLGWVGAVLGWMSVPYVIILSSLVGSLVGLTIAVGKKSGLKTVIPFGPYLALAALSYIFVGRGIALWYLKPFFPWLE